MTGLNIVFPACNSCSIVIVLDVRLLDSRLLVLFTLPSLLQLYINRIINNMHVVLFKI